MRKPKYITAENYQQFKPSEFVASFTSDIEVAERLGKPMDMAEFNYKSVDKGCLPCLGGMACLNWGIEIFTNHIAYHTAFLGDYIRKGQSPQALSSLKVLFPGVKFKPLEVEDTTWFLGNVGKKRMPALKAQVLKYVHALEAQGL